MSYKITSFYGKPTTKRDEHNYSDAYRLMNEYGLGEYYTVDEVERLWSDFSETYAAGWLSPYPDAVERCFNVTLTEIKNEESN